MYQCCVAILVHEDTQHRIKQIGRVDSRVLKIILTGKNATSPIKILATYAPGMGYTVEEKQHRNIAQETIGEIPTTNLCLSCADANGKLGHRDRTDSMINKISGMNTIERMTKPGNV